MKFIKNIVKLIITDLKSIYDYIVGIITDEDYNVWWKVLILSCLTWACIFVIIFPRISAVVIYLLIKMAEADDDNKD